MLLQRYHGDGSQPLSLISSYTYAENLVIFAKQNDSIKKVLCHSLALPGIFSKTQPKRRNQ